MKRPRNDGIKAKILSIVNRSTKPLSVSEMCDLLPQYSRDAILNCANQQTYNCLIERKNGKYSRCACGVPDVEAVINEWCRNSSYYAGENVG